mgnify:FL=1
MNIAIRSGTKRSAMAFSGLLLLTTWLGVASQGADEPAALSMSTGLQDAAMPDAGDARPAPSSPRRLNSSLSMPYFSFAKSLKSRS